MNNILNLAFMVVLAIVAFYTGEIVTFVMLGFILVTLQNMLSTLNKIYKRELEEER